MFKQILRLRMLKKKLLSKSSCIVNKKKNISVLFGLATCIPTIITKYLAPGHTNFHTLTPLIALTELKLIMMRKSSELDLFQIVPISTDFYYDKSIGCHYQYTGHPKYTMIHYGNIRQVGMSCRILKVNACVKTIFRYHESMRASLNMATEAEPYN